MAGHRAPEPTPVPTARRRLAVSLALTGGVLAAVAAPLVTGPAAAAPLPRHVAVVVQGVGSACIDWHSGLTAADAVKRVAAPVYSHGKLVKLGSRPSDPKKYKDGGWFYYRVASGSWTHSTTSSADTRLSAGSVDGWTYSTKGKATAPTGDASDVYDTLCGSLDRKAAPSGGDGGNGISVILSPSTSAKTTKSAKPSSHAPSADKTKPSSKKSTKKSKAPSSAAKSAGTGLPSSDPTSSDDSSPAGDEVTASKSAASKSEAAKASKRRSRAASSAAASPVASEKDADGPGLGVATGALVVLLVGGGAGLWFVRRRLTGGANS